MIPILSFWGNGVCIGLYPDQDKLQAGIGACEHILKCFSRSSIKKSKFGIIERYMYDLSLKDHAKKNFMKYWMRLNISCQRIQMKAYNVT